LNLRPSNIIVESLFNNKEININISNESIENDVLDCLYIDKNGFLFFYNNHKKITINNKKTFLRKANK
jgi:hypothetical protein